MDSRRRSITRSWACCFGIACATACGGNADLPADAGGPPDSGDASGDDAPTELACPAGQGIELDTGSFQLTGPCDVEGDLHLSGDARLAVDGFDLSVTGDIVVEGQAVLQLAGGTLTLANEYTQQYRIDASGSAQIILEDASLVTRAEAAVGNISCYYYGRDDSLLRVEDVELDNLSSWLLGDFSGNSRLEAVRTRYVPTEIYPSGAATIRIDGPDSTSGVWLLFPPGTEADLDDLPAAPITYSFGRDTPGVQNIDYQVDITDSFVGISVLSGPASTLSIRDNDTPITIGYIFAGVTAPEQLSNLPTGTVTATFANQGRSLSLTNAVLGPIAWQIYIDNTGVDNPALVTLADSTINELAALANGRVLVNRATLQWAVVSAERASSDIEIHDSIINSQLIKAAEDGQVRIFDSSIWGAQVEPSATGRIVLVNTTLNDNRCHPGCSPVCTTGGVCNPYNPSATTTLQPRDSGAILVSRLTPPPATVPVGTSLSITGDVFADSVAPLAATYTLAYRREPSTDFVPLVVGGQTPRRDQVLGTLNTTSLTPGTYTLALVLNPTGEAPVVATRRFELVP